MWIVLWRICGNVEINRKYKKSNFINIQKIRIKINKLKVVHGSYPQSGQVKKGGCIIRVKLIIKRKKEIYYEK